VTMTALKGVVVSLSPFEMMLASQVGMRRQIEAIQKGLPDRHGYDGDGWNVHIEGAGGEMAVAKALNRYWNGSFNTFQAGGDVGSLQVRTRSREDYDLLVRESDRDDDIFVLVTGKIPRFVVWGWLYGRQAKQPEWRKDYGGRPAAYFIPKEGLNPISHLFNGVL